MSESIASLITLSALIVSVGWYIYQSQDRSINHLVMCLATGALCLFGGFLISGAIMKVTGPFENPLIASLLVLFGTLACIFAHTLYRKKTTPEQKPTN